MAMVAVVPSRTTSGYDVAIEGSRSPLSKVAIGRGLERELLEDTGLHLRALDCTLAASRARVI
jgi:hypothetical protein